MTARQSNVRILSTPPHVTCLSIEGERQVFVAALEANVKQPSAFANGILDTIANEAAQRLARPLSRTSPREFARHVADAITGDAKRWREVGAVIYAGVLLAGDAVYVCTAGDLRVHVVEAETCTRVTRDHNAVSDDATNIYADAFVGMPDMKAQIITRAVPSDTHEPECAVWHIEGPAAIVLASSSVHRYRDPAVYAPHLRAAAAPVAADGFVAVIDHDPTL